MNKKTDYKKQLTLKGNSVKRTVKEYDYYLKDVEKEKQKLQKITDEKKDEGEIKRQTDYVGECEGAAKQTFKGLEKWYGELTELVKLLETPSEDAEEQKLRDDAKALEEFTKAKEYLEQAKAVIEKNQATNAA